MTDGSSFSPKDFGATFKGFMESMVRAAPEEEPFFSRKLREHFGRDPVSLQIVSQDFDRTEHANLHLALEANVLGAGREHRLFGVSASQDYFGVSMAQLARTDSAGMMGQPPSAEGPVQYVNLPAGNDEVLACVKSGLYLACEGDQKLAVLLVGARDFDWRGSIKLEVMAPDRAQAEQFVRNVRDAMRKKNVYRGRVISLQVDRQGLMNVSFHRLPQIAREDIVLPAGLLERIERLTIDFSKHRDRLRAAGRHMKRGLLFYGSPGTGKTLTAMHLASRMPDRTVLLLTGSGLGLVEKAATMARALQPATLILEDADLVAEERTQQNKACNTVLFELLNQMDGLADDADVLFLLTTNRPEMLEPALASRPGRIDQALEIPLPDADARRKLLALYGKGLSLQLEDGDRLIDKTKGVSGAFMKELLRKAALFAVAENDGPIVVQDKHLDDALYELVVQGGDLTKSLLGATSAFRSS